MEARKWKHKTIIKWVQGFSLEWEQKVVLGKNESGWKKVTSGVRQGSVLGAALFFLYINDLPNTMQSFTKLFVNDTKYMQK